MTLFKIFVAGWGVLVFAILLNILAANLKVDTWFGLFEEIKKVGVGKALQNEDFVDIAFQFIIYPLLLGLAAYLVFKLLD